MHNGVKRKDFKSFMVVVHTCTSTSEAERGRSWVEVSLGYTLSQETKTNKHKHKTSLKELNTSTDGFAWLFRLESKDLIMIERQSSHFLLKRYFRFGLCFYVWARARVQVSSDLRCSRPLWGSHCACWTYVLCESSTHSSTEPFLQLQEAEFISGMVSSVDFVSFW